MASKKAFALRISDDIFDAVQRWADDDLRSVNGQIEFLLRDALRESGRLKPQPAESEDPSSEAPSGKPSGQTTDKN